MKRPVLGIAAAVALALSGGLHAAESEKYGDATSYSQYRGGESPYRYRASDLIGSDVVNAVNDTIGDIDDLVLMPGSGSPKAILSIGGFLGIGDRLVAVPLEELRISADGDTVFLDTTLEQLESRPEFIYNDGESRGIALWEERLQLRSELTEERKEVEQARQALRKEQVDVRKLEAELKRAGG